MTSRRDALKRLLACGGLLYAGAGTTQDSAMLRRPLPKGNESLPVIGLGTYQAFDVGSTRAELDPLADVLRTLVRQGGSVVDSSPMYGRAEGAVGEAAALAGVGAQLFHATKVWTSGRDNGIRQMEESFRLMRVERMDLMQIHNLQDWRTHTATLRDWQQRGRVRYLGITHYHEGAYGELETLLKTRQYDFVQLNFSIAERTAEERVLPLAQELGVAVIANRPFAQANLFRRVKGRELPPWAAEFDCDSWAQFFLKYIVSHPAVTCAIPATSKTRHAEDNLRAGYGRLPDAAQRERMARWMDSI